MGLALGGIGLVIVLVAVVIVASRDAGRDDVAGQDSDADQAADPDPTGTTAPARAEVDLSPVQLQAALLRPEDLGMTENVGADADTTDRLPFEAFDADAECLEELARFEANGTRPLFGGAPPGPPRRATVELTGYDLTMEHEIDDGLDVTVADYRALFETCEQITFSHRSRSGVISISEGSPMPLGDDSLSLEYIYGDGGSRGTPVLWVLWERDSILSSLNVSGGGSDAPYLLRDGAAIADARLEEVIG